MILEEIQINNYKSVEQANLEIGEYNTIIGKNNSGKSAVIDLLSDYRLIILSRSIGEPELKIDENWIRKRLLGKKSQGNISIRLNYKLDDHEYEELLSHIHTKNDVTESKINELRDDGAFRTLEHLLVLHPDEIISKSIYRSEYRGEMKKIAYMGTGGRRKIINFSKIPGLNYSTTRAGSTLHAPTPLDSFLKKSLRSWHFVDAFRVPDNELPFKNTLDLEENGRNLAQVLKTVRDEPTEKFEKIEQKYSDIMEGVTGLRVPGRGEKDITVEVDEKRLDAAFDLSDISSGSKEILVLITQIVLSEDESDLLLIEEPELHLHPGAERDLLELLLEVANEGKPRVFITTHSEQFVNETKTQNIIRVDRQTDTGISEFISVDSDSLGELLDELGYEQSQLLQSSAVVFVEGRSDQRILNELSRKIPLDKSEPDSFDDLNITVHALKGSRMKKHGSELSNLLGHMRIPFLFVVDSDDFDTNKKEEMLRKEYNLSNIHVLDEYCIESYLLNHPRAIADAFNFEYTNVSQIIDEQQERPNKKQVIKDLFKELGEGVKYDEETHGWSIARHIRASDLDSEMEQLVRKIKMLSDN